MLGVIVWRSDSDSEFRTWGKCHGGFGAMVGHEVNEVDGRVDGVAGVLTLLQ